MKSNSKFSTEMKNLVRSDPKTDPPTIGGIPVNQSCQPDIYGTYQVTGSTTNTLQNHINYMSNNIDVKNLVDNMNSFIEIAKNSLFLNNSNNLLNNNINNNTDISNVDSIISPESKNKSKTT